MRNTGTDTKVRDYLIYSHRVINARNNSKCQAVLDQSATAGPAILDIGYDSCTEKWEVKVRS